MLEKNDSTGNLFSKEVYNEWINEHKHRMFIRICQSLQIAYSSFSLEIDWSYKTLSHSKLRRYNIWKADWSLY